MEVAGVEVMLVTAPENIFYLTGFHTLGYYSFQILIIPLDRDPVLLTRALNLDIALRMTWLRDIEIYTDTQDPNEILYGTLVKYRLTGRRLGNQNSAWFFSVAEYDSLVARLGGRPIDCSGMIEKVRLIKSPSEVEYIRAAGRCVAAFVDAAIEACKPGATENDVTAAGHYGLYAAGSEYIGHAPLMVCGTAAGLPNETFMRRAIAPNDHFFIEAGGTYGRYNACLSRTVFIGNANPRLIRMAEISREALNRAKARVRAGVTSEEVDAAARDYIREQGLEEAFQHRLGYSMGIGFPPDWGEGRIQSINTSDRTVLRPGMVFHLIPDLKVRGLGGVVFSETVLVSDDGCDVLTPYTQDLAFK